MLSRKMSTEKLRVYASLLAQVWSPWDVKRWRHRKVSWRRPSCIVGSSSSSKQLVMTLSLYVWDKLSITAEAGSRREYSELFGVLCFLLDSRNSACIWVSRCFRCSIWTRVADLRCILGNYDDIRWFASDHYVQKTILRWRHCHVRLKWPMTKNKLKENYMLQPTGKMK